MKDINKIDYNDPILNYFDTNESVFICLFPFYKKVFVDHFNWESNLKLTYPLLETVTWAEVSEKIGFNDLKHLALGILELKEPFTTELKEYCEQFKMHTPDYAADKFPEKILIPILDNLKTMKIRILKTKQFDRFPSTSVKTWNLEEIDNYSAYYKLSDAKYIITENDIQFILPDYDCPYMILAGDEKDSVELIEKAKLEIFRVDSETSFYWWYDK